MRRLTLMNKNERIVGILHEGDERCVIGAHGLQSSKESEKMKMLGERFSSEGISFFRFDFRGCGESDGDESRSTLSERISDLLAVMRFLRENEGMRRFSLVGSSFGGCVSLVVASSQEIEALVTLATPVRFEKRRVEGFNELYREDIRKYDLL
ncbi:MAG: alpha/beta hydrolase, partial [Archaeoglobi archaeon]|nr:alpha/beta hydrolase [Candidatus Mnemosynella sp.]